MIYAAMTAVAAFLFRQSAFYLESWRPKQKICLGFELSEKWADFGNNAANGFVWIARALGAVTIVILMMVVVDRYS